MGAGNHRQSFRIWQLSDLHLAADPAWELYGINSDDSLRQVLSTAQRAGGDADLCLLTGDLVHDDSRAGYLRLLDYVNQLRIPVYCLPGNHDSMDLMQQVLVSASVSCQRQLVHRQWLMVLLDTTVAGSEAGHLSVSEYRRFERLVRQYPEHYILLAMHHPPLSTGMAWLDNGVTLDNPQCVQELVENYPQIRVLIWGHAHQAYQAWQGDVLWAGCPSTMAQFKADVRDFELDPVAPGFRYLDLHDDGRVTTGVIRVPP